MYNVNELKHLLELELTERFEEGYDISGYKDKLRDINNRNDLLKFYQELEKLKMRPNFPYIEPSSLSEIKSLRPSGPREISFKLSDEELYRRILGGWIGRCAGCMLGKPVEGRTRKEIKEMLLRANAYPLRNYFLPEIIGRDNPLALGNIQKVERDDDIDYTILNLSIVEKYGINFTTEDVGRTWLQKLPYLLVYTAERAAYRNLILGFKPPRTATFLNPYREWIGAQIRADMWGYLCPGLPELAAELAFKDASLSHTKNGIYGEMFISAIIAASFAINDIEKVVEIGLSEIPSTCRLTEAVKRVLQWWKQGLSWEEVLDKITIDFSSYHPVHTINNATIVVAAILWSEGNYEKAITMAVMGGWDTDCNGATVGSIMGVLNGIDGIPKKWYEPLNNIVSSAIVDFNFSKLDELAKRTFKITKKILQRTS